MEQTNKISGRFLLAAPADIHLSYFLLDCPASEPLRRAIFGTTSPIFDLWAQTLKYGQTDGSPRIFSALLSLGRGRVAHHHHDAPSY